MSIEDLAVLLEGLCSFNSIAEVVDTQICVGRKRYGKYPEFTTTPGLLDKSNQMVARISCKSTLRHAARQSLSPEPVHGEFSSGLGLFSQRDTPE